jgi:hypothetical protein
MAEWCRLHPKDVAGEEAFWAAKKVARRERRRVRKRLLKVKLSISARRMTSTRTPRSGTFSGALPRKAPY